MWFGVYHSSHSQSMTRIKTNIGEHENFGVCDSNHSLHMIRIMQLCDLNHKLYMTRITYLMLAIASFDSNHTSHMTRITSYFTFIYLVMSNLTWVRICTWSESWTFMTRIRVRTWPKSQENMSLFFLRSYFTLLAHLTQIMKCS